MMSHSTTFHSVYSELSTVPKRETIEVGRSLQSFSVFSRFLIWFPRKKSHKIVKNRDESQKNPWDRLRFCLKWKNRFNRINTAFVKPGANRTRLDQRSIRRLPSVVSPINFHPKTLIEIAMVLSTNSCFFPSNLHVSTTFSILLRFGESWNPTNCEKFNADGSLMGRTNLDKSVW